MPEDPEFIYLVEYVLPREKKELEYDQRSRDQDS